MGCLLAAVLAGANGTAGSGPLEKSGKDGAVPVGRMSVGPMSWREAAMKLLGVSQWEELDEEVAERLEDLLARPLPLNTASLTAMQESGLLSFYQCAVIEEWRARNGDILSFEELAMLDGFSHETAQALRPFVSLAHPVPPEALPGRSSLPSGRTRHNLTWRVSGELSREREGTVLSGGQVPGGAKAVSGGGAAGEAVGKGSLRVVTGLKYAMDWSGRLQCGLGGSVTLPFVPRAGTVTGGGATSASSAGGTPSAGVSGASSSGGGLALSKFSWDARALHPYIRWNGRKWLEQVLVGDYQLRFSQGLCLWSGFSLSGFSAPDSFVRRPTGISPYGSFSQTPALRGVAARFRWGAFHLSVAANVSNWLHSGRFSLADDFLAAELNWHTRRGFLSLTGVSTGKVSLGGHFCWGGFDVFGEACFDGGAGQQALGERLQPGASTKSDAPADAGGRKPAWAALAGTCLPLADGFKASLSLRYYSPDFTATNTGAVRAGSQCANEAGAAIGLQWKAWSQTVLTASVDACLHPRSRVATLRHTARLKMLFNAGLTLRKDWSVQARAVVRLQNYDRTQKYDLKCVSSWQPFFLRWEAAKTSMRLDAGVSLCHCASWGVLLHAEESVRLPWGNIYLQEGWYSVQSWDDRLYLYEHSAPGSFSVPARYGEGWFVSLFTSLNPVRSLKIYLGAGYKDYVYRSVRHRNLEVRLQIGWTFP